MQKLRHLYKKRAVSLGASLLLIVSILSGSFTGMISVEAEEKKESNPESKSEKNIDSEKKEESNSSVEKSTSGMISNESLSVQIGDLGQISLMNIKNNPTNNKGDQVNFVLPNDTSPQNGVEHQWMGEMIFSYRTSEDGVFPEDRSGFVEIDTNKTLAAGGSTTYSDATENLESNPYIKKNVINDKRVEVDFIGHDEGSTGDRTMKGFDVKSVYDMDTEDGSLLWEITLSNKGTQWIEFGDVGLPMPWNNKYTTQDSVYNERVTVHTFAGADSGYAYAVRCSGEGNYVLFTPVAESGARIEYIDNWVGNNNGVQGERADSLFNNWTSDSGGWQPGLSVYYIHSKDIQKTGRGYYTDATSLVLGPEESKTYQFKFSAVRAGDNEPQESANSTNNASTSIEEREGNMRSILYNAGLMDAIVMPSFQTAINMPTKLDLHYNDEIITDVTLDIQCVHENDPFDEEHIPMQGEGLVNNSRGGRGTHDGNPDYNESVDFVETKTIDGEKHHIYDLTFGCIGNNSVRVDYKLKVGDTWIDKFTQYEFNVLTELDEAVKTHSEFMLNNQHDNDPDSPTYGNYNDWYFASGVDENAKTHWGDDWSHDNINFMTMKNYLTPDAEESKSIERYLIDFMWGNYMKYTQETYVVANYLRDSGIYATSSVPYNRAFSEVMEVTGFFNMYRIQKAYPDLMEYRETPEFYLDKAYQIYYNRISASPVGFYGEQQIPEIIEALKDEGMTTEANNLQTRFARDKGRNMANAAYPYGSEFVYDNTGEEGAYAAAKALRTYYPNHEAAGNALKNMEIAEWKTRAMRGIQPTWYHYANPVFIGGEHWWNFQYTASLAGSIMDDWLRYQDNGWDTDSSAWAQRMNYGAKISNFNAINMGQISKDYIGNVGWRYTMYKGGHGAMDVFDGGTRVMNNGWNDFSGEADQGIYGSLLRISSDVVKDPIFGLVGYGSEVSKNGDIYTIIPKDGFGKRLNLMDEKIYLTLEQDSASQVKMKEDGSYFHLNLKTQVKTEHLSKIDLSGPGLEDGFYSIKLDGQQVGQCYVKDHQGRANVMIPSGDTAEVTIEKMDGGKNEAPYAEIVISHDKLQAFVPFDVKSLAYDDGAPNKELTYKWEASMVPEGATLTFDEDTKPNTQGVASAEGEYEISLTVSDGELSTIVKKTMILEIAPDRASPTIEEVTAIQDSVNISVASLNGKATPDPLYNGELEYEWSIVEEPEGGHAIIGNANQSSAIMKASVPGTYLLRFQAVDADVSSYEDVAVEMVGEVDGAYRGLSIVTKEGTAPTLPEKVEMILEDGTIGEDKVHWKEIDSKEYESSGLFFAEGTVVDSDQKVKVAVYVVSEEKRNLATVAEPSAIINSVHDLGGVASLNDGKDPSSSEDVSNGAWHNWLGDQGGPAWMQYEWQQPIIAESMDVYVFRDGGGNFQPKDMKVTLRDEKGTWYTPRNVSGLGNDLNQYNTTTFEPSLITGIRIDMNPVTLGCGILEWKVNGYEYGDGLVDKTELRKVYSLVNSLNESQLLGGLDPVKEAMGAVESVLSKTTATQEEVKQVHEDLLLAMKELQPVNGNLAFVAGLTASYTSSWESLPSVRDGVRLSGSHWGTWGNDSSVEWLEYSWPQGVMIEASDLYLWNDGGGIETPASYTYTYLPVDSDEWVVLERVDSGMKENERNHITFEEAVAVRALRCTLTKPQKDMNGVGVWEWEVYSRVDKKELELLVEESRLLEAKDYHEEGWEAFKESLDAAVVVLEDENTYQAVVDDAFNDLKEKKEALIKIPKLKDMILKEEPVKTTYLIDEELDLAGMVLEFVYEDSTTKIIDDLDGIQVSGFDHSLVGSQILTISYTENDITLTVDLEVTVKMPADMSALNLAIVMGQEHEKEQNENQTYTSESYAFFQLALDQAREVAHDKYASQERVDTAFYDLITGYANLEISTVKYGLKAAIAGTMAILDDPETAKNYSVESIQMVEDVLAQAQIVAEDEHASQDEIHTATRNLITAVNSMLRKDDTRLAKLIKIAEEILTKEDK
ncbi:MAG TPA: Ig-like domain-containing protein [Candidatus Merdenecus merdavium]|nr:Ig-like domain-containing protein [Candidatus Merdenecus merdavium]